MIPLTPAADVEAWRRYCTGRIAVPQLAGGHLSVFEHLDAVANHLVTDVDAALADPTANSR